MSSLIKSRDAGSIVVTPLGVTRPSVVAAAPVIDPEILALRRDLEALTARLAERDAEIVRLRKSGETAHAEGEAAGREAGRQAAEDRSEEILSSLRTGIDAALARYAEELASLGRLSALVAREGLAKLVGDGATRAALLEDMIRAQIEKIDGQAIVRIDVSRADFSDAEALDALKAALGDPRLDLRASDELDSGDCTIRLVLGALEVGIDQQWGRLSGVLSDLAVAGGAR